jgi:hypothetical protein
MAFKLILLITILAYTFKETGTFLIKSLISFKIKIPYNLKLNTKYLFSCSEKASLLFHKLVTISIGRRTFPTRKH